MATDNDKVENVLNLAAGASSAELENANDLSVGFNQEEQMWELIIRYSGDIDYLTGQGVRIDKMLNQYAVLTVPEHLLGTLEDIPEIDYIEKPKRLFFAMNRAKSVSCINSQQNSGNRLTGRGVIVAVIDSGIDYYHQDFRNADGSTRLLSLWDQVRDTIYTREQINEALQAGSREAARAIVPSVDISGHGTAVAGIAAGNGRESDGQYRGIAYESELIVVKLGVPDPQGFPRTTELMKAVNYVVEQGIAYDRPVVINVSFGNTYGGHDGTSLLETFMDDIINFGKVTLVVGTGNEGAEGGHVGGNVRMGQQTRIEMSVGPNETGFSVQLWKSYADIFGFSIQLPSGEVIGEISPLGEIQRLHYAGTRILLYYGQPSPYSQAQELYMEFIPMRDYVDSGIWTFILNPQRIVLGRYDFWLPSAQILNQATRFLQSTPDITLTIPSTAAKVLSVGAYDDNYQSYADFSGRGYTRMTNLIKPEIAAPGVNITTSNAEGGYRTVTGTSFATAIASGSTALLMQWGIVDGNDPFLYGEKVKAYFTRGARQLPGVLNWPNPVLGYGALCLSDSIPL